MMDDEAKRVCERKCRLAYQQGFLAGLNAMKDGLEDIRRRDNSVKRTGASYEHVYDFYMDGHFPTQMGLWVTDDEADCQEPPRVPHYPK